MARETYVLKRRPDGAHDLVPRSELSAWLEKHYPDRANGRPIKFKRVERGSWVWRDGKLVAKSAQMYQFPKRGYVISDIEPYRNIAVDNKVIGGRRQHREMLRAHKLVEVGTEKHDEMPRKIEPKVDMGIVNELKRVMGKL